MHTPSPSPCATALANNQLAEEMPEPNHSSCAGVRHTDCQFDDAFHHTSSDIGVNNEQLPHHPNVPYMQLYPGPAPYYPGAVHPSRALGPGIATGEAQGLNGYNGTYSQYQDISHGDSSIANYSHHPHYQMGSQVVDLQRGFVDQNLFMDGSGHAPTAEILFMTNPATYATPTLDQRYVVSDVTTGGSRPTNIDPPAALTRADGGRSTSTSRPRG
ncbi:hypothetical protein MMC29_006137 [Sticta canariensis]|nr:hypothetical protein [Sticta canariensis]